LKSRESGLIVAGSFEQMAKRKDSSIRFQTVDGTEKQMLVQRGKEVRKFREERQVMETQAAGTPVRDPVQRPEPARVRLPKSSIVAKPVEELGKDRTPPKRQDAPEPDPKVEAKPRKARARDDAPRPEPKENPKDESKDQPKGKHKKKPKDD